MRLQQRRFALTAPVQQLKDWPRAVENQDMSLAAEPTIPARIERLNPLSIMAGLAVAMWSAIQIRGFSASPLIYHGIRQTQTGWAIRTISRGGPILRYQVPLDAPFWSAPLEFPTYQAIVGKIIQWFNLPLEQSAHFISVLFSIAAFVVGVAIQRTLGRSKNEQRVFAVAYFASPVVAYWSHTITIEFVSLSLTLCWALFMLQWRLQGKRWALPVACAFGVLAAPTKFTTFAPTVAFFILVIIFSEREASRTYTDILRTRITGTFVGMAAPALALFAWTKFAASIHRENGGDLAGGSTQVFGTLAERTRFHFIGQALWRLVVSSGSAWALCLLAALLFRLVFRPAIRRAPSRSAKFALVVALPFFITPLIFFHVHVVHDYYSLEILLFLFLSGSALAAELPEKTRQYVIACAIVLGVLGYAASYLQHDESKPDLGPLSSMITEQVDSDEILIIGQPYLGMLSYMTDRRALEISPLKDWARFDTRLQKLTEHQLRVGGFVACYQDNRAALDEGLRKRGFVSIGHANNCEFWAPRSR